MDNRASWVAVGTMLAVLIALYVIAPKGATSFAVGILIVLGGYGFANKKFSL